MNRHHQSWITVIHRRLFPRCYGGFGRSWGYPQIIQSWGSMVTTRDPNDKFTKPHDIPMIFLYSPIFHGNSHELSTDLPYSYGIPMIFLWYSYDIPMNSPQIFQLLQIHGLLVQRLHGCAHVVAQGGHQELVLIAAIGRLATTKHRKGWRWGGKNRTNQWFSWLFYQKWWGNHRFFDVF